MSPIADDDFRYLPSSSRRETLQNSSHLPSRLLEIVDHFLHKKNDPMKADKALRKIIAAHGDELPPATVDEAVRMIEVFMHSLY